MMLTSSPTNTQITIQPGFLGQVVGLFTLMQGLEFGSAFPFGLLMLIDITVIALINAPLAYAFVVMDRGTAQISLPVRRLHLQLHRNLVPHDSCPRSSGRDYVHCCSYGLRDGSRGNEVVEAAECDCDLLATVVKKLFLIASVTATTPPLALARRREFDYESFRKMIDIIETLVLTPTNARSHRLVRRRGGA
mmetsp:Transcript_23502/g.48931  ORF Transcript_23502/g.48931 Transcript_23502/m.48931 type:complete len:192 (-) Transcript_23502:726-1301(-)